MKHVSLLVLGMCGSLLAEESNLNRLGIIYSGDIDARKLEEVIRQAVFKDEATHRAVYSYDTIDTPGFYKLAANVSNQITISASNVTLDMMGHTVSGGSQGIAINGGLSNVTIKNGVINAVTNEGIVINAGCSDILLDGVTVKNATTGINVDTSSNCVIRNCLVSLNNTGLEATSCQNIYVEKCIAQSNRDEGFSLVTSTTCSFINCSSLGTGEGATAAQTAIYGFVSDGGFGNIFEQCVANGTHNDSVTDYDAIVAGFGLTNEEKCSKIVECEAASAFTNASTSGFTMPYGIYLESSIDSTSSVTTALQASNISGVDWSPDGKYVAIGGGSLGASGGDLTGGVGDQNLQIFEYDYVNDEMTPIAGALGLTGEVRSVRWSHDGKYVLIGGSALSGSEMKIFEFDRVSGTLTLLDEAISASAVVSVSWSPNDNFVVGIGAGFTSPTADEMQVYRFDRITQTLSYIAAGLTVDDRNDARGCDWHPKQNDIIAVTGPNIEFSGDQLYLYQLDPANATLTLVEVADPVPGGQPRGCSWSPDGKYIVVIGTTGQMRVYSYDETDHTLTTAGLQTGIGGTPETARWSSDGRYIATASEEIGGNIKVYRYNRDLETFTLLATGLSGEYVDDIAWSPDGTRLIAGIDRPLSASPNEDSVEILTGLTFPSQNVIQNNKLYCNTGNSLDLGFGISGSSICNLIIGNVGFDNACNYAFCANVFNQLFGDAPTALQNVSLNSTNPIQNRIDLSAELCRLEKLAESLIDNLL